MWARGVEDLAPCPPAIGELQVEVGDGRLEVYRYPKIEASFRSDAHSPANLLSQLTKRGLLTVLSRACLGLKPITTIAIAGVSTSVLREALAEGMEVRENEDGVIVIAMTGIVGDHLDVEALIADWARYLQESRSPAVLDCIERELRRVAKLPFAVFENTQWVDVAVDWDVGGFARAGLLYGYPPESTAAIIGEGLGISGCAHALIDSDPEFAEFLGCGDPPGTARRWTEPPFLGSYEESLALDSDIDAQGVGS